MELNISCSAGHLDAALPLLHQACASAPDNVVCKTALARLHIRLHLAGQQQGELQEARKLLQQVLEAEPWNVGSLGMSAILCKCNVILWVLLKHFYPQHMHSGSL